MRTEDEIRTRHAQQIERWKNLAAEIIIDNAPPADPRHLELCTIMGTIDALNWVLGKHSPRLSAAVTNRASEQQPAKPSEPQA